MGQDRGSTPDPVRTDDAFVGGAWSDPGGSPEPVGRTVRELAHALASPIASVRLELSCLGESLAALEALPLPPPGPEIVAELRDIVDNLAGAQQNAARLLETLHRLGRTLSPAPAGKTTTA